MFREIRTSEYISDMFEDTLSDAYKAIGMDNCDEGKFRECEQFWLDEFIKAANNNEE